MPINNVSWERPYDDFCGLLDASHGKFMYSVLFFLVWVWTWALCCWKWTMFIVWHLFVVGGLIYELHLLKPPILFLHECTLASTALRGSLGFIYPQFIWKTNASQHRDFYCGPVVILFCFCLGVCFLPNHSDLSCGFVKACILACMLFYYNVGGGVFYFRNMLSYVGPALFACFQALSENFVTLPPSLLIQREPRPRIRRN